MKWLLMIVASLGWPHRILEIKRSVVPTWIIRYFDQYFPDHPEEFWALLKGRYIVSFHRTDHFYILEFNVSGAVKREMKSEEVYRIPGEMVRKRLSHLAGFRLCGVMVDTFVNPPVYSALVEKGGRKWWIDFDDHEIKELELI